MVVVHRYYSLDDDLNPSVKGEMLAVVVYE